MKHQTWHAEAREEFADAALWYDERASNGQQFMDEVGRAVERLRSAPEACALVREVDDDRVRRARVQGFPYHVVFVDHPRSVFVVAVAHTSRRPGYWKDRLPEP
ncbi:type II toxin-antitoxin system RelE/ParE family toxin [bacterium]|nr:type II toxin-antitoxin system RelE/ParE family toxin [bacterium]